ncbi:proline-rich protein HaeIII subfamily 1-like [Eublepharis macularius]|uniref:Proline-rich protein HaeIII subfamily 1-like n=1 Tax=Eublepharis macularius TaxID=481883 RepID=A0AA97KMF9_EUBMA|nr:proline-rich protein HaeIII subfamily 1-like [Eublepharis macularius]
MARGSLPLLRREGPRTARQDKAGQDRRSRAAPRPPPPPVPLPALAPPRQRQGRAGQARRAPGSTARPSSAPRRAGGLARGAEAARAPRGARPCRAPEEEAEEEGGSPSGALRPSGAAFGEPVGGGASTLPPLGRLLCPAGPPSRPPQLTPRRRRLAWRPRAAAGPAAGGGGAQAGPPTRRALFRTGCRCGARLGGSPSGPAKAAGAPPTPCSLRLPDGVPGKNYAGTQGQEGPYNAPVSHTAQPCPGIPRGQAPLSTKSTSSGGSQQGGSWTDAEEELLYALGVEHASIALTMARGA